LPVPKQLLCCMKKLIHVMAASLIVLLAACNKDAPNANVAKPQMTTAVAVQQKAVTDSIRNPLNPYDSIGLIHNQALQVTWDYLQKSGDTTSNGIRTQVIQFFGKRYGSDITVPLSQMEHLYHEDFPAGIQKVSAQGMVSPLMAGYLNQIVAMVKSIHKPTEYKIFNSGIISLAQNIITDKQLTATQKEKLLMVSSISRYSIAFWIDKANRIGGHQEASTDGFFHWLLQAINCGLADVGAAASGISYFESPREVLEDASDISSLGSVFM
jgi:hypothetical protein